MLILYRLKEHLDAQDRLETELVSVFRGQWLAVKARVEAIPLTERKRYLMLEVGQGVVISYWNVQSWLEAVPFITPTKSRIQPPSVLQGRLYAQN